MAKKPHYDPKRNARLAWLSINGWGKSKSDARIIIELMAAFPGVSEKVAREDMRALYQRLYDINQDNFETASAQMLEQSWKAYTLAVNMCQMSAAANLLKHIHGLMGYTGENRRQDTTPAGSGQPIPAPDIIRERIHELMKKRKIQEEAQEANIDLKDLADKAGVES
jgi:hypothetical protein